MIKKIAFIGGRDIHSLGGIENYMLNLSQLLVKHGYKVVVYCESDHNSVTFENGVKIVSWRTFHWNMIDKPLFGILSTLHAIFVERKVDLFHYNAWMASLGSWIPPLFRKKSLMQGHGLEWQRTKYSPFQQKILKFMEFLTAHTNRNLIMVSQDQTDFFKSEYGRICKTITPGISLPQEVPSDVATRSLQKFGVNPGKYFLFLGRLVRDKNPDKMIQAFLKIHPQGTKLVIAGNNPANPGYVEGLKKMAEGNDDVIFTGAIYGEDKESLLSNALAFCIPSTLEGLPISLLEAMSYSRHCIASDIPGCREALGDECTLIPLDNLVDGLADALQSVVDGKVDCASSGQANKQRVSQKFTWDNIVTQYENHINTL